MILHINSWKFKLLMWISSPTQLLPRLIPLRVQHVRIGESYSDFVRVTLD